MRPTSQLLALALVAIHLNTSSILAIDGSRPHEVRPFLPIDGDPAACDDGFVWQTGGPLKLIQFLKSRDGFTVRCAHVGWVKASDIPELLHLLDSDEPCADVRMAISSRIYFDRSTVGREAAFLIEGFRRDYYPPGLNSLDFDYNPDELRAWWKAISSKGAP